MAKFLEFVSQFLMVVDFAVEHDSYIGIFGQNRLVAETEVYNLEPRRAYRAESRLKNTLLVRSTMNQCGDSAPNAIRIRHPTLVSEANNSTQLTVPLSLS